MSEQTPQNEDTALPYGDERSRVYKAAGGGKRCLHLLFVPAQGEHDRLMPFSDIRQMELRKDGRELLMEFSDRTIIITGRNLRPVAMGIGSHMCSRLEAFDESRRDQPTDDSAPFIETIAYYVRDTGRKPKPAHEPETVERKQVARQ